MKETEPGEAAVPGAAVPRPPPRGAVPAPRSEALEAELGALEAMLPPEPAVAPEPPPEAAAGEGAAGVS